MSGTPQDEIIEIIKRKGIEPYFNGIYGAPEKKAKLINEDCYGKGWLFKFTPDNMDELKNLMTDPAVMQEWLKAEIAEHGKK